MTLLPSTRAGARGLPIVALFCLTFWVTLFLTLSMTACNSQAKRAKESVDAYLKPLGVKDTSLGTFVIDPDQPDRAYISVIARWNFADISGQPQKESLGYVLHRNGPGWSIDKLKTVKYTDEKQTAIGYLHGKK